MKKIVLLTASIVFLMAGMANADTIGDLYVGGYYTSNIYVTGAPSSPAPETGGSIDPSTLNGVSLEYLYCVDLYHDVYVSQSYPGTVVTSNGYVDGALVNKAPEIAWLLSHYGVAGQGNAAAALQAAIWHVEYGYVYLNSSAPLAQQADYNSDLAALNKAIKNGTVGDLVSNFLWITPGGSNSEQGLVGYIVPEPCTMLLLGSGLAGLAAFRKKFKKA